VPSVAVEYQRGKLGETEQQTQDIILGALNRFSNNSLGSETLLAFGLHFSALKELV